ncbi:MAG: hypothetical protein V1750_11095 [Acidobacteriota bacterium]
MELWRRLLARPRLVDELRFVLSGALVGAAAGLALALLALPPQGGAFATAPPGARWFLAIAPGAGGGWWGGLVWSVLLSLAGRRQTPPAPVASLLPATAWAASVLVAVSGAARLAHLHPGWGAAAGLALAALAARLLLAQAARRCSP